MISSPGPPTPASRAVVVPEPRVVLLVIDPVRRDRVASDERAEPLPAFAALRKSAATFSNARTAHPPPRRLFQLSSPVRIIPSWNGRSKAGGFQTEDLTRRNARGVISTVIDHLEKSRGPTFVYAHFYEPHASYEGKGTPFQRYLRRYLQETARVDADLHGPKSASASRVRPEN